MSDPGDDGARGTDHGAGRDVSAKARDRFVAGLDYPMYVATAAGPDGADRSGCLVGFATQCGIEPFRFLLCLSTKNRTYRVARASEVIVVHALDRSHGELAALFGGETGDETDKFARCSWRPGPGGAPVLDGCPRWFAGRVLDRIELGDHEGFLLAPIEVHTEEEDPDRAGRPVRPLMFSGLPDIDPGHPA